MVRNLLIEAQTGEPAPRQVHAQFLHQLPLAGDAVQIEKGMRPTMARLTLARKLAAISLTMWKKGVDFDAKQLHQQAA